MNTQLAEQIAHLEDKSARLPELSPAARRVALLENFLGGDTKCDVAITSDSSLVRKFSDLIRIGAPDYKTAADWWVQVSREKDGGYSILRTSDRATHSPLTGKAYSVDLDSAGNVTLVCKSTLSMWRVRDAEEAAHITNVLFVQLAERGARR